LTAVEIKLTKMQENHAQKPSCNPEKSNHRATLNNEHLEELIYTALTT